MQFSTDEPFPLQSFDHALVVGMVLGTLLEKGVSVSPQVDDHDNFTATLEIPLAGLSEFRDRPALIRLVVLPREDSTEDEV